MGIAAKLLTLLVCCGSGAALAVYVAHTLDSADGPAVGDGVTAAVSAADQADTQPAAPSAAQPVATSAEANPIAGDPCHAQTTLASAQACCERSCDSNTTYGLAAGVAMTSACMPESQTYHVASSLPVAASQPSPMPTQPALLEAPRLLPDVVADAASIEQASHRASRPAAATAPAEDAEWGSANQPRRIMPRRPVRDASVRPAASEETTKLLPPSTAVEASLHTAQTVAAAPLNPNGSPNQLGNLLQAAQELSNQQPGGQGNVAPALPAPAGNPNNVRQPANAANQPRGSQAAQGHNGQNGLSIRRSEDLPQPGNANGPHTTEGPLAPPPYPPAAGPQPPGSPMVREHDDHLEIYARNQDIRDVLALLSEQSGLNIVATRSVTGQVSVSLSNVSVEKALEAVLRSTGYIARQEGRFIYVGTPADFLEMEQAYDRIGTRIFRPYYVSAAELQTLITPLLTPSLGKISVSTPPAQGIGTNDNEVGGDSFSGGDTLLVQDRETVLREIEQVVRTVDCPPMQVAIEAMILSVTLGDKYECGVDFQFLRNQGTIRFGIGSPPTSIDGVNFENGGLKFAYLDSSLGAFIKALETIGDTSVIATPRVMVLNKQRAEVLIGGQLGYVNTTVTETTATQSVEFLEVGTQLRIRPFISPDGMIRMEVHPELSTGNVRIEQGLTLPDKQVTKVTSNVMVRDGSTVIIGGLMRDNLKSDVKQMPLMGNLPLLGKLFRTSVEETTRTEIVVLLTPRIVQQDELAAEGNRAACEFHLRHAMQADYMSDWSRDHLCEKYCHLAKQAYRQGDREKAWRYIQLAVEINPGSRKAINLRARMAAGVEPHLLDGPLPGEVDGMPLDAAAEPLVVPENVPANEPGPHLHEPHLPAPRPNELPPPATHRPAAAQRMQAPRPARQAQQPPAPTRRAAARPQNNPMPARTKSDAMSNWVLDELTE